jgi:hypothetical protein
MSFFPCVESSAAAGGGRSLRAMVAPTPEGAPREPAATGTVEAERH